MLIERYLAASDARDVDRMVDCFAQDAFYSHPPNPADPGAPRLEFTTRDELRRYFDSRESSSGAHSLDAFAQNGPDFFAAGRGGDPANPASWVAVIGLDEEGLISTYAVYTSHPAVGSALQLRNA